MRPWMANVLGVGASALALGAGLMLGAPEAEADAPAARAVLGTPAPLVDGSEEIPLGEAMELWGRPTRLSMFWTPDSADEVLRTYLDAWSGGEIPPAVQRLDKVTSVSAFDLETGLMRSVTIMDQGNERIVMPNVTDVRGLPELSIRNSPVPIPETAKNYMGQVADDTTSIGFTATYLVALEPERALQFYDVELGQLGYQAEKSSRRPAAEGAQTAEFTRGPEWVTVVATPTEKKATGTSLVMVSHVRTIAPEGE